MQGLLLPRIAAGDQSAVPECISRYGSLIWSLARRRLASRQDAEDAVQEVFVDLWRSADRFDPLVAEEITFVAMIARRRVIDTLRRRTGLPQAAAVDAAAIANLPDPGGDAPVGRRLELGDEARLADEHLDQLKPEEQRLIRLSVYDDLSHAAIAERTGRRSVVVGCGRLVDSRMPRGPALLAVERSGADRGTAPRPRDTDDGYSAIAGGTARQALGRGPRGGEGGLEEGR